MSLSIHLLLLSILLRARCVSADDGDDFANNLFSDLAPLLALFGERVTMQFMSGAMGWADNIILAMAPLGIITAIVAAIRVGGPSWLKAVIGRARGNLAVAEAELMSSTSQEVCELWNGQEIVRCMGSPSVVEFICLLPTKGDGIAKIEVESLRKAFNNSDEYLRPIAWVRRGLATPPKAISLPSGYELDWFAKTLGKVDEAPSNDETKSSENFVTRSGRQLKKPAGKLGGKLGVATPSTNPAPEGSGKEFASAWRIASSGDAHFGREKRSGNRGENQGDELGRELRRNNDEAAVPIADAQTVLKIRKDLGYLAKWRGPASTEAVSLARAIEIAMDALIGPSPMASEFSDTFYWSLDAVYDGTDNDPINFEIWRQADGKWKSFANEYDAALSLWLSTAHDEKKRAARLSEKAREKPANPSEYEKTPSVKLSENDEEAAARLNKSVPLVEAEKRTELAINREDDMRLRKEESKGEQGLRLLGLHTTALRRDLQWWVPEDLIQIVDVRQNNSGTLVVESERVFGYNQQIWAKQQKGSHGENDPEPFTRFTRTDLPNESTDNDEESKEDKSESGRNYLAAESYASLPLLFAQHMFSAFMHAVASTNERGELFQTVAKVQPNANGSSTWNSFTLRNESLSKMIREIEKKVEKALRKSADPQILSKLMMLYTDQDRAWKCNVVSEENIQLGRGWENKFPKAFNFTIMHGVMKGYIPSNPETVFLTTRSVTAKDILHWTPLHYAVRSGKRRADRLLLYGANVDSGDLMGWTPLHYFCQLSKHGKMKNSEKEKIECFHDLIQGGANVNAQGRDGTTPLHWVDQEARDRYRLSPLQCAIRNGHEGTAILLIKNGAKTHVEDPLHTPPLQEAVDEGFGKLVALLIHKGAGIDAEDEDAWTLLHRAAFRGHTRIVKFLLRKGAKRDSKAIEEGHEKVAKLLLEKGVDVDAKDKAGITALHRAIDRGQGNVVKLLLKKGVDIEAKDEWGDTPLHSAFKRGKEEVVKLLLKKGVNIEAKDNKGETPLHKAVKRGEEEVVKLLLKKGVDIEAKDEAGTTPLHRAIEKEKEEVVKLLLKNGADIEAEGRLPRYISDEPYQLSPLHWAAGIGHANISRMLVAKMARTDAVDNGKPSPLSLAIEFGYLEVAKVFIDSGSNVNEKLLDGITLLHKAVANGGVDLVKHLIDSGVDREMENDEGRTARQMALEIRKEITEWGPKEVFRRGLRWTTLTVQEFDDIISLLE
ncbi:hypothetical protein CORC01_14082 [Colletotrichum orchidophilum]|uniref:Uncharacterized protein n=1 Tax=Colletotrichum orchidophilum TaxID=1209926 RepID=A0A1G4AN72_9PEZI|nr:uncharacterized protein CORC01_14082 [Colletotrichum orchidophilum]OHE90617.1 hypothetical protein CORC01_14082 [Colletotrichum orchidophilum]